MRSVFLSVVCLLGFSAAFAEDKNPKIPVRQENLVVTGQPQPVPLEQVDRAVTAIDVRNSTELFRSFTDFLFLEPSLDLQQRGPNGVQGDLSIRGSTFGQTLVLVNGFRVNDPQTGHHNLDLPFPLQSLERIEILRGAGSTLYGSDAMGGAVNFIVAPPETSEIRLDTAFGSFGTNMQQASAAFASRRLRQQLSVSRDFSTGFAPDRDYRSLLLSSTTHFESRMGDSTILLGYGDRPFGADQFYGKYNSWERTKSWFASLRQQVTDRTELDFGYRRHTDNFILRRDRPTVYANNHETESWQAAVRRRQPISENATLFYGAEGYRDSISSSNLGHHARNRGAAYANFDLRAWHRFSFAAGVREEVYGNIRGQLSPTVSAGMWLPARLKLRASLSNAFRLPTFTELYYRDPATIGNADLRAESAWSYEGGLDWHAMDMIVTSLTVFHRRECDGIDYVRSSTDAPWRAMNLQRLNFTGVEASAHIKLSALQELQFSYTAMRGVQESLGNLVSRYVGNYPTQNGVIAWQGKLPGEILGRTRLGVTTRTWQDPYALWDVSLARQFGWFSPYVQFANIPDTKYQEIRGVAMPGRSFLVGMQFVLSSKKQ